MSRAILAHYPNTDLDVSLACRDATLEIVIREPTDTETTPEAIAAAQRRDVARWWRKGVRTVATLSRRTVLPVWNVRRRLFELGLGPNPTAVPVKPARPRTNHPHRKYPN